VTNDEYIEWLGKPMKQKIVKYRQQNPLTLSVVPKGIGFQLCDRTIKMHGILMETLEEARELTVEMYRIEDAKVEDENQKMTL
jgi:hypothetical protein